MKFIDEAVIQVSAGKGGAGCSHFRREKYVPFGGPDGGNGGRGGSVIVVADRNKQTLLDFHFKPLWEAEQGRNGGGNQMEGRAGEDLIIHLPVGTVIYKEPGDEVVVDLAKDEDRFVLCKGGRGGRGNEFFKSATNRAPTHAQPGEAGEEGVFRLSLKLVADVGLIGFPNAGKSTLISRISEARPKIADYPFTTLVPNLGVTRAKGDRSFVVADIPGLIPGAHEGRGLGLTFLKHVERTRLLVHLIDPNQLDEQGEIVEPMTSYKIINHELRQFSADLAAKQQVVALTKIDSISDREALAKQLAEFRAAGISAIAISSASGEGIPELIELMASYLFTATNTVSVAS